MEEMTGKGICPECATMLPMWEWAKRRTNCSLCKHRPSTEDTTGQRNESTPADWRPPESAPSIQRDLTDWANAAFPGSTDQSKILRLFEKLEQSFDATDDSQCRAEITDAGLIALLHLVGAHGIEVPLSNIEMEAEMRRKLEICKTRIWDAADFSEDCRA